MVQVGKDGGVDACVVFWLWGLRGEDRLEIKGKQKSHMETVEV